jgi:hypothetical protein
VQWIRIRIDFGGLGPDPDQGGEGKIEKSEEISCLKRWMFFLEG